MPSPSTQRDYCGPAFRRRSGRHRPAANCSTASHSARRRVDQTGGEVASVTGPAKRAPNCANRPTARCRENRPLRRGNWADAGPRCRAAAGWSSAAPAVRVAFADQTHRAALRLRSEETMRRSFLRLLAATPQDYRARFSS